MSKEYPFKIANHATVWAVRKPATASGHRAEILVTFASEHDAKMSAANGGWTVNNLEVVEIVNPAVNMAKKLQRDLKAARERLARYTTPGYVSPAFGGPAADVLIHRVTAKIATWSARLARL